MSKRSAVFFACLAFLNIELMALTSGVAVPCYYKHFKYLPGLLKSLTKQTRLPDEVIISLSQVEHLKKYEIDKLEAGPWPFTVKIIRRVGVFMEGSNRTTASKKVSSDVVICIDADDIPHPQRVEAIMQLFETVPSASMVLCGHAYCPGESIVCEKTIPHYSPGKFMRVRFRLGSTTWKRLVNPSDLTRWMSGVHNGSPSLKRTILKNNIFWSDLKNGADLEFNRMIINKNYSTYLIHLPLLHYYNGRSSGTDIGR